MAFKFPFPTLKNFSMITFGKAVLEIRTRRMLKHFRYFYSYDYDESYEFHYDESYEYHYEEICAENLVPSLLQIRNLRHDLAYVINGMLEQTRDIVLELARNTTAEDVALIFDVHGRLDIAAAWRCYIEDQLDNAASVQPVMDLLNFAIGMKLWCEIHVIIAKIMSLVGLNPDSLLKTKLTRDVDGEYRLTFSLGNLLSEPSSANIVSQLQKIFQKHSIFLLERDRFHIHDFAVWSRYLFWRKFFITMDTSEKESFIQHLIPDLRMWASYHQFSLEILTDLDDVMLRQVMRNPWGGDKSVISVIVAQENLCYTLHWPFTQFFMPLLELLTRYLNTKFYATLFRKIAEKVPDQCSFGTLYSNLLLRFCQAIPLNVKRELFEVSGENFTTQLKSLRHKNVRFHDRIVKILSPQVE